MDEVSGKNVVFADVPEGGRFYMNHPDCGIMAVFVKVGSEAEEEQAMTGPDKKRYTVDASEPVTVV